MTFKMSEKAQTITIYNLRADTLEFIGAGDAYIPPHTGLPAYGTEIKPPAVPAGKVAVFDSEKETWGAVEDHRGMVVFNTETGSQTFIAELGPLPANTTSLAPDGQYQKWNGTGWVKDEGAEKAAQQREAESEKTRLMQMATNNIAPLQDAVDLDMATDEEVQQLSAWKKYRVLLSRVDTSTAPDITWPEQPATVVA